jgi:hypothetical protein
VQFEVAVPEVTRAAVAIFNKSGFIGNEFYIPLK